ncbi:glycosyltransferase [Polaribacter litorisediminis]|uniref:glycosyltransferase family 2 protein n=1 Tax=Polaribacter litorisediminis TaxID=1908341 RepID=UPI001CBE9CED|nr:glycosyltransferase family 2 protein [Polaribacter litorisediminis]UAM96630.1 glycosyltransferase [Polaribacter litorisediminis]
MKNFTPLVSIITITYNHEKYIKDTILGVLKQKCDFDLEFIISNDKSTDNTDGAITQILKGINVPDNIKIRYFNHDKNKGVAENFIWIVEQANGKYLAYCEGDDYWTNPFKLQTQVDLLENNGAISMSTHEASFESTLIKNEKTFRRFTSIIVNGIKLYGFSKLFIFIYLFLFKRDDFWKQKRTHDFLKRKTFNTLDDFKNDTFYMAFCTIVVRRQIILEHIDCFKNQAGGHQTSLLIAAMNGLIHHSTEIMSVKRDQESSVTKDDLRKIRLRELSKNPETNEKIIRFKKLKEHAKNTNHKKVFDNLILIEERKLNTQPENNT